MCVQIKFTVIQNTSTSALLWISQLCIARPGFQEMSCLPSSVVASLSLPLPPNVLPPTHHASKSETEHKVPTVFTKTFHIKSYRVVILTNISAEVYKYCQNAMLQKTIKLITWLVQSPCYAKATQDDSHHLLILFNIFSQPLTFNAHWHFTSPPNEGQLCSSLLPKRILRGRTMVTARMSPIKTAINTLALAQETTWKRDHHLFGHMEN